MTVAHVRAPTPVERAPPAPSVIERHRRAGGSERGSSRVTRSRCRGRAGRAPSALGGARGGSAANPDHVWVLEREVLHPIAGRGVPDLPVAPSPARWLCLRSTDRCTWCSDDELPGAQSTSRDPRGHPRWTCRAHACRRLRGDARGSSRHRRVRAVPRRAVAECPGRSVRRAVHVREPHLGSLHRVSRALVRGAQSGDRPEGAWRDGLRPRPGSLALLFDRAIQRRRHQPAKPR